MTSVQVKSCVEVCCLVDTVLLEEVVGASHCDRYDDITETEKSHTLTVFIDGVDDRFGVHFAYSKLPLMLISAVDRA